MRLARLPGARVPAPLRTAEHAPCSATDTVSPQRLFALPTSQGSQFAEVCVEQYQRVLESELATVVTAQSCETGGWPEVVFAFVELQVAFAVNSQWVFVPHQTPIEWHFVPELCPGAFSHSLPYRRV